MTTIANRDMMRCMPVPTEAGVCCGDCGSLCETAPFFDLPADQAVFVDCTNQECRRSEVLDLLPLERSPLVILGNKLTQLPLLDRQ